MSTRVIKDSGCSARRIIYIFARGEKTKFWLRSVDIRRRRRTPAGDDRCVFTRDTSTPHSFAFVYGADHHFFNTDLRRGAQLLITRVAHAVYRQIEWQRSLVHRFFFVAMLPQRRVLFHSQCYRAVWNEFSSNGERSLQLRFTVCRKPHSEAGWKLLNAFERFYRSRDRALR
jgi:hypothetical protein